MSLRTKTLIIIGLTFVGLLIALYTSTQGIIVDRFKQQEEQEIAQNVERVLSAVDDTGRRLAATTRDWAGRDDTYEFIQDLSPEYVRSNLASNTSLVNLRLNLVLYIDAGDQVVFSRAFDYSTGAPLPLPNGIEAHLTPQGLLNHASPESSTAGLLILPDSQPILIASEPIVRSERTGPIRGTLIFGRYLDPVEVQRVAKTTLFSLLTHPINSSGQPEDFKEAAAALAADTRAFVKPLNADSVAAYALINDIYGKAALIVRAEMPRTTYARGQESLIYFMAVMLVAGLIFAAVTLALLERLVLSRLVPLSASITTIGASRDLSRRTSIQGRDELSKLGNDINGMLEALEHARDVQQESNALFRAVVEQSMECIFLVDVESRRIIEANESFMRLLGYSAEELAALTIYDIVAEDPESIEDNMQQILNEGRVHAGRRHYRRKDGSLVDVEVRANLITCEGRKALCVVADDITEHTKDDEELRKSESRYRLLLEQASDGIVVFEQDGSFMEVNSKACEELGYTREELLGMNIRDILSPEDLAATPARFDTLLANEAIMIERRLRRKDGTLFPVEISAKMLFDGRIQAIARNITERKEAEQALRDSETQYRMLLEHASDGIVIVDRDGAILEANSRACEELGYTREEMLQLNSREIIEGEGIPKLSLHWRRLKDGRTVITERTMRRKDGSIFPAEISAKMLEDGRVQNIARNITERRRAEVALRASERRYRLLFERNLAGVFRATLDGKFLDCNDAFTRILGFSSRKEILNRSASEFFQSVTMPTTITGKLREQGTLTDIELPVRRKDGKVVWVLENLSIVEETEDSQPVLEGTIIDITERKLLEQQLTHQAFHDALTGLPNRALFMDRLAQALQRSKRHGGTVGVLFLDLDAFKMVNDTLGHNAGDQLLVEVSKRLQHCLRSEDSVARIGGDEFTVLLESTTVYTATRLAERIERELQTPVIIQGEEVFVTCSIGIALSLLQEDKPDDLLRDADVAMYEAKNRGKGGYAIFNPSMNSRVWERVQLENDLRRAVERKEFTLYYQPVVQIATGKVVEVEALVRWIHPRRGLIGPMEFIPLAEETGLILPLGQWVLEEACKQVCAWQQQPGINSSLSVSVNLSARQFQHPDLVEDIKRAIKNSGLAPRHLKLEITEGVALINEEWVISTLWKLKNIGIQIALDDFGTGYSSLGYLKRFPVDLLKLDRSFINGLGKSPEDTAIVSAVLAFARALNLTVTAEGIETAEQLRHLQELNCEWGQGYLFSRPLSSQALNELLMQYSGEGLQTERLVMNHLLN